VCHVGSIDSCDLVARFDPGFGCRADAIDDLGCDDAISPQNVEPAHIGFVGDRFFPRNQHQLVVREVKDRPIMP